MKKNLLLLLIIFLISTVFSCCEAKTYSLTPSKLARIAVENYFNNKKTDTNSVVLRENSAKKPMGVFVTILDTSNQSKGCWGKLYPQADIKQSIINAAVDAATKDYRKRPLSKSDLKDVKFQVSIVTQIVPVSSTRAINPYKDGLLARSGSKTGIILAGEATDSYYQMVMAKLKANIQPKEKCELFKLITKTYKE
jgi:AMMECR1 domain-containing protein